MEDIRQSPAFARHLGNCGWVVERINNTYCFIRKFPLVGAFVKIQRPNNISLSTLEKLNRTYKVFQYNVEPTDMLQARELIKLGFKQSKNTFLPSKTLRLDLTLPEEKLLENLKKDARYCLRKVGAANIYCSKVANLSKFRKGWKGCVGWRRYIPGLKNLSSLQKSFRANCLILQCTDASTKSVLGGAIFLKAGKTVYYWQAFTGEKGREKHAQYLTVWEGILWAKKKGATVLDLEGIYDERFPDNSWRGFTHFKKSFGGAVKEFPGCYTMKLPAFLNLLNNHN